MGGFRRAGHVVKVEEKQGVHAGFWLGNPWKIEK
jgi:hypothetical protein